MIWSVRNDSKVTGSIMFDIVIYVLVRNGTLETEFDDAFKPTRNSRI